MIKTYQSPKLTLAEDEVFVFTSNNSGYHGAGSAGYASFGEAGNVWRKHEYDKKPSGWKGKWNVKGASVGPQVGTEGKSYAIPTVTQAGAKRSIPLETIKGSIQTFYAFAKSRPHLKFFVAQENKTGLNGYTPEEMASIYSGEIPENVYFDEGFAKLLNRAEIAPESYKIVHCKKSKFTKYIGRPKAGGEWGFGNPFEIGKDGDRPTVISKMKQWLKTGESFGNKNATPERRKWILDHVHELKDETLGCWCNYPEEDCHGRVLLELANKNKAESKHVAHPIKRDKYSGNRIYKCECGVESSYLRNGAELEVFVKKHQGLKTIVAGSRSISDYNLICAAIKESGFKIAEIVSGTAKGVDSLGEQWAKENNIPVKRFPAPWDDIKDKPESEIGQNSFGKKYWKRAGAFRNQQMADYADALIAITTGSSGTADMINRAEKKGLKVFVKNVSLCESCEKHPARPLHTCPYAEEINNSSILCNCCEKCEHECCMDI